MAVCVGLLAAGATPPSAEEELEQFVTANAQSFVVRASVDAPEVMRDDFGATPGYETFIAGGTNHDWAKLVLLMGEFPLTDSNVTVVTRWMRQENYVDAWWTRNNPLNNGWGSGGGGGTGTYVHLVDAAENAAEALHTLPPTARSSRRSRRPRRPRRSSAPSGSQAGHRVCTTTARTGPTTRCPSCRRRRAPGVADRVERS